MRIIRSRRLPRRVVECASIALTVPAMASTIHVPADQPTIQAGINAAANGDTVLVAPGTYNEAINFNGKTLAVQSEAGAKVTTIDADGTNSSAVTISGHAGVATLQGFIITRGDGTNLGNGVKVGGGVNIQSGSVVIRECWILNNTAIGVSDPPAPPGPNNSGRGGGVYSTGPNIALEDCLIAGNVTHGDCGGGRGGGAYIASTTATILNCTIEDNGAIGGTCAGTGTGEGGGLYLASGSTSMIVNTNIVSNGASGAAAGSAGVYNQSTTTMINCCIAQNVVDQCCGPTPGTTSGIVTWSPLTMRNCTIVGNIGAIGPPFGPSFSTGGVRGIGASHSINLSNCIVYGNDAMEISGSATVVNDSCIEGGYAGSNNIGSDPLFVDAASSDYRLSDGSPCRDVGNIVTVPADQFDLDGDGNTIEKVPFDVLGQRRIVNGSVDLGAFEWQRTCEADISPSSPGIAGDGAINVDDLLAVINGWGECDGCVADVDGDNSVDVDDLLAIINGWGRCQ